ncbi:MAG: HNH endonuclease [Acholeplasmatales bacterium]|nr:HNH endonuclease [Acholeplasmatales bacterium]
MFWVILVIILIILAILSSLMIFFEVRKSKYINFIEENSVALKEIKAINGRYVFYVVRDYSESYVYDNENFYNNISCQDYLIYQLQFAKKEMEEEIKKANSNKLKYTKYLEEVFAIKKIDDYNASTEKMNITYLKKLKDKMVDEIVKTPKTNFIAIVHLDCSTINGRVYGYKYDVFEPEQILSLISRLNNKSGSFYNDRGIWDAICRVERGKVSNKMRFLIYQRDGYRCCKCGRSQNSCDLEIDHIKPIAKGGKSTYDNLQTLCSRCNKEKGDKY